MGNEDEDFLAGISSTKHQKNVDFLWIIYEKNLFINVSVVDSSDRKRG